MKSSASTSRRWFLKAVPATVAAAPVVAKEAAARSGLSSIAMATVGELGGPFPSGQNAFASSNDKPWFMVDLERWLSPESVAERRGQAERMARCLPLDLASMRAISPAAAYRLNVDRMLTKIEKEQKDALLRRKAEWLLSGRS